MEDIRVRDVMLGLDDYAVVREDATIIDAIRALDRAQERLEPGRQPHRAVLVVDKRGKIVGKVGHFAFLKGLEPSYCELGDWEAVSRAGLSAEFVCSMLDSHRLWHQGWDELRRRVRKTTVGEIMRPVAVGVAADSPLTDAIHLFVMYQTLSLLVREGEEVVGILRLSDVFTRVFGDLKDDATSAPPRP